MMLQEKVELLDLLQELQNYATVAPDEVNNLINAHSRPLTDGFDGAN